MKTGDIVNALEVVYDPKTNSFIEKVIEIILKEDNKISKSYLEDKVDNMNLSYDSSIKNLISTNLDLDFRVFELEMNQTPVKALIEENEMLKYELNEIKNKINLLNK